MIRLRPAVPRGAGVAEPVAEIGMIGDTWAVFEGGLYLGTIPSDVALRASDSGELDRDVIDRCGFASCGCTEDEADHQLTDYTGTDIDTVTEEWRCVTCRRTWQTERTLAEIHREQLEQYPPYYMADQ